MGRHCWGPRNINVANTAENRLEAEKLQTLINACQQKSTECCQSDPEPASDAAAQTSIMQAVEAAANSLKQTWLRQLQRLALVASTSFTS